jgi:hypothetical protein
VPFPNDPILVQTICKQLRLDETNMTEDSLVKAILEPKRKMDVYWATIGLRSCGTERSIPLLRNLLMHPMKDVKCIAILTIAHIGGANETELYAEELLNPKYPEKGYAMWAILDAADERAVDAVLQYFHANQSRLFKGKLTNGTLVDGMIYLDKYRNQSAEAYQFLQRLSTHWNTISNEEQRELSRRAPDMATWLGLPTF